MVDLAQIKNQLNKDRASQTYLQNKLEKEEGNLKIIKTKYDDLLKVRGLFQKAAQDTQQKLEFHISNLVSTALAAVFENPYEFQLEFVQKRGKTEADLWFVKNNQKMKPVDASGGGACDIASLALRAAFWSLTKSTRPIFIIDEPFRNLDATRQSSALEMLKMLSDKLKLQIIMASHIKSLIGGADKEFKIQMENGKSNVVV